MNKVIGTYEDLQHDQIISFVYNSDGLHHIVKCRADDTQTSLVLEWEGLDFQEDEVITGIGVLDDLLFWTSGRGEIKQINMARRDFYDTIKANDPFFANLIKRPGLLAPVATKVTAAASIEPNYIRDETFQFSYRYVYVDEEKSVFAPFSTVVGYEYKGENADTKRKISVQLPASLPPINPLVKRLEFAVKRGSQTGLYIIRRFDVPQVGNGNYAFEFDNSFTGEAVPDDDAARLFDNIPVEVKALTVARNRIFIGDYREGYDSLGTGDVTLSLDKKTSIQIAAAGYGIPVWKSRSSVKLGVEYVDEAGRSMGVYSKPEWDIKIPELEHHATGSSEYTTGIKAALNLTPPVWAKGWNLVRTKSNYAFFLEGMGKVVHLQPLYNNDPDIILQYHFAFANNFTLPIKETYIDIATLSDRNIGYAYEPGDLLTVTYVSTISGNPEVKTVRDISIIEQKGSLLRIPPTDELTQIYPLLPISSNLKYDFRYGVLFQIHRPNKVITDTYYRTGLGGIIPTPSAAISGTFTVTGDSNLTENTLKADLKNNLAFQSPSEPEQTVDITSAGSDFFLERNGTDYTLPLPDYGVYFPMMEAMSGWDKYYAQWPQSLGQPVSILPTNLQKQVYKPNFERFSNKYLSGTQVNGLNSFEAFNEKELPRENGPIQKLQLASNIQSEGSVLLAVMQNETESQYLGEVQFKDTQGQTTVAISDQVIGSTNTLRGGFGTINPESVVHHNSRVYFWDVNKAEPVRYGGDGLTPLATQFNMRNFFREISRQQLALGEDVKVYGGYYPEKEEYLMRFTHVKLPNTLEVGFTIAFSERLQGFTTRYEFKPEYFAKINTRLFSFDAGKCYRHGGEGTTRNNFYGVQHHSAIRYISNLAPDVVKIWHSVVVEGTHLWIPKDLRNERGQLSRMNTNWFEHREGVYYGGIRFNLFSKGFDNMVRALNNGEPMRSQWLELNVVNEDTTEVRLDKIATTFIESSGHNELR